MVIQKLKSYQSLMRLNKPIGFFLLLWPTLSALCLAARGVPAIGLLCVFIIGTLLMRSAGCVINDIADRKFDKFVQRTQSRPLVSGTVTVKEALVLVCILFFFALLFVLTLNKLSIFLAFIGFVMAITYPLMKRWIACPQVYLGLTFSWGIPMGYAAVLNTVPKMAWLFYLIIILWTIMYDTMYAMVDREDDLKIGLKSTAILFGSYDLFIIRLLQVSILSLLILMGVLLEPINFNFIKYNITHNIIYDLGLLGVLGCFVYQSILIRHREPLRCFRAFLNNHYALLCLFLGILLKYEYFSA